jgi:hypothetical protein
VVGIVGDSTEKIYNIVKSYTNGIALDELAKQYQVSSQNPAVLISLAQLLADGRVKQEMRGEKLYCVAIEMNVKEPGM